MSGSSSPTSLKKSPKGLCLSVYYLYTERGVGGRRRKRQRREGERGRHIALNKMFLSVMVCIFLDQGVAPFGGVAL